MRSFLFFSLIVPLMVGGLFTISKGSNPRPDGPVTSYQYSYSGTMRFPTRFYEVKPDSTGTVCIYWSEQHSPDVSVIRAPEDALEHIGALVKEYKLHRLKSSYRPRMQVLDGYGWHMYVRFSGNSISTGGTNAWPPAKLNAGIHAINAYIGGLIEASAPEDIIRVESHLTRDR